MGRLKQIFKNLYKCFIKSKNSEEKKINLFSPIETTNVTPENLVEKWDRYGLMPNMPYGEKVSLATKYERMAMFLLDYTQPNVEELDISILMFPILYRVFRGIERDGVLIRNMNVSTVDLCDKFIEFRDRNWRQFQNLGPWTNVDYEAEFMNIFVEDYLNVRKYNNSINLVKKKIKKHKLTNY